MKQLLMLTSLLIILILFGCSDDERINNKSEDHPISNEQSNVDLIQAIKNNIPSSMHTPFTYGILDRDKTEDFCNVVFIDYEKKVYCQFCKTELNWMKLSYEKKQFFGEDISLRKTNSCSPTLAELYELTDFRIFICDALVIENIEQIKEPYTCPTNIYDSYNNKKVSSIKFKGDISYKISNDSFGAYHISWTNECYWICNYLSEPPSRLIFDSSCNDCRYSASEAASDLYAMVHVEYFTPHPDAPVFSQPSNNSITDTSVCFSWQFVTGQDVDKYKIFVYEHDTDILIKSMILDSLTNSICLSGFEYSTKYRWCVTSHNRFSPGDGWGQATHGARYFTVKDAPAPSVSVQKISQYGYKALATGHGLSLKWYFKSLEGFQNPWFYRNNLDNLYQITYDLKLKLNT